MTMLFDDPVFQQHETGPHPECPSRVAVISAKLAESGLAQRCGRPPWEPVDREVLALVHDLRYVDSVERFAERGGGYIEADTSVSTASYQVACSAVGAVVEATRRVVRSEDAQALCLVRPPGHHALATTAMGFCLFNNIAIAARVATGELELDRVLIVDWDVHHGNGTQAAFWRDEQVGLLSIHRTPFFPGTGAEDERGEGPAAGTICNVPIIFGTSRQEYFDRFTAGLHQLAERLRPQLVLISAGFDTHRQDPVGSLGLEDEDFATLTRLVLDVADVHAGGRVVSVLEGGYNLQVLPGSIAVHLETLLERQEQD